MAQIHWLGAGMLGALAAGALCVGAAYAQQDPLPEGPGKTEIVSDCSSCHGVDVVATQKRTKAEWDDVLARMVGYGSTADVTHQKAISDYLLTHFGKPADGHS